MLDSRQGKNPNRRRSIIEYRVSSIEDRGSRIENRVSSIEAATERKGKQHDISTM